MHMYRFTYEEPCFYIGIFISICNYPNGSYFSNKDMFELLKIISDIKFYLCSIHRILTVIPLFSDCKSIKTV